jgi:hypothetical protein
MSIKKSLHEGFAKFFEMPTRESLRNLLRTNVGETDNIDFKLELPEKGKLAKHMLALANSGGGVIISGVKDGENLEAVGTNRLIDKSDIQKQVFGFLPDVLEFEVLDFPFRDSEYLALKGKTFQVVIVESNPKCLPYFSKSDGADIRGNTIYVRKGTNSAEASGEDVQRLINRRLDTGFSSTRILSLEEHLEQLKLLYKEIPRALTVSRGTKIGGVLAEMFASMSSLRDALYEEVDNPDYPKEGYHQFIARAIEVKKKKILSLLEV